MQILEANFPTFDEWYKEKNGKLFEEGQQGKLMTQVMKEFLNELKDYTREMIIYAIPKR